jgi:uncharacterized protein (DUF433 family)
MVSIEFLFNPNEVVNPGHCANYNTSRMQKLNFLSTHPEIQCGSPVFYGTHIRYETFQDYMRIGVTVREFLDEFPSVTVDQAVQAAELRHQNLSIEMISQLALPLSERRLGSR